MSDRGRLREAADRPKQVGVGGTGRSSRGNYKWEHPTPLTGERAEAPAASDGPRAPARSAARSPAHGAHALGAIPRADRERGRKREGQQ